MLGIRSLFDCPRTRRVLGTSCKLHFLETSVNCEMMFRLMRLGIHLVMSYYTVVVGFYQNILLVTPKTMIFFNIFHLYQVFRVLKAVYLIRRGPQ